MVFLGFWLDSRTLLTSLPVSKIQSVQWTIRRILAQEQVILKLSQLLGSTISTHPVILPAPLLLLPFGESQDNSSEAQSELQHSGDNIGWDEEKANLVAPTITQTQWQVNAGNSGTWWWSPMHQHWVGEQTSRTPVQKDHGHGKRKPATSTTSSCWQQFYPWRPLSLTCITKQSSWGYTVWQQLPFSTEWGGGDSFSPTLQCSSANLEMVFGEKYIHPCKTPPRETQCESRLALSACTGLQRLADAPANFPPTSGQAGPLLNRSVCIPHECPAPNLLQLEAGSISSSNQCHGRIIILTCSHSLAASWRKSTGRIWRQWQ